LIFRPALFSKARNWLFAAIGLAAGLAFHLLIIPMAAADPYLNSGSPDNLERFWQYVSLKQYGGGFLFDLLPRKAPFWSVQVIDYLRAFSANFFNWQGRISPLGLLPGFFGLIGIISLWRRDRRLSLGLIILFLFASLGAVIYLNIPENFFRAMYRHYLPSFFIFTIWMAYGIGSLLLAIIRLFSHRAGSAYAIAAVLLLLLPGYQLWSNYNIRNFHNHYFTYDWARNVFATLPENSIIYCFGDNDTHPLWYLQAVENARPDVAILNIGLTNIRWYIHQIAEHHPDLLFHNGDPALSFGPRPWTDTTISIPAEIDREEFDLGEEIELPDSVHLTVTPDLAGKYILPQHSLLLNLIKNNQWQRPIYFSIGGQGILPEWLAPYLRFEGLAFRLVPVPQVPLNPDILARNLMEEYSYRGYSDEGIYLDDVTRKNGIDYLTGLLQLAQIMVEKDDQRAYQEIRRFVKNNLPPEKLQPLPLPLKKAVDIIFEKDPPAPDKEFPENESTSS
jgi:hypothetical protein